MEAYVLVKATNRCRIFPPHGFTYANLLEKYKQENLSRQVFLLYFVIPFEMNINVLANEWQDGILFENQRSLRNAFGKALILAIDKYATHLAARAVEISFAALFCHFPSSWGNGTLVLWDSNPRWYVHYIGNLLCKLRLPSFLGNFLGSPPRPIDLELMNASVHPLAAMEDTFRRHLLSLAAATTIDIVKIAFIPPISFTDKETKDLKKISVKGRKCRLIRQRIFIQSITLISASVGSGLGQMLGGPSSSFWSEMAAVLVFPVIIRDCFAQFF